MTQKKLYTEEQVRKAIVIGCNWGHLKNLPSNDLIDIFIDELTPIVLPTDEEIESKYNKFIDDEIQLGFLKQEQGERLKWYYKTYFINKIQGGNK